MSTMKQIADSLVTHLQTMQGMPANTVVYRHVLDLDLSALASMAVVVTPAGLDVSNLSRSRGTSEYRLGVYVAKRVATHAQAADMLDMVESIVNRLRSDAWSSAQVAFSTASVDLIGEDGLDEAGLFRAKVEVSFKRIDP